MTETKYVVRIGNKTAHRYLANADTFSYGLDGAAKHDSPQAALNALVVASQRHSNLRDFGQPFIIKVQRGGWEEVGNVFC